MVRLFVVLLTLSILADEIQSQNQDTYLKVVSENNPEIISFGKLLEARRLEARTNLTPPDPEVSYGYLPGNPDNTGVKKIWSVTQSFDFPTRYLRQGKLNKSTVILAEQEFAYRKLMVLLEAKLALSDLIYRKKYLQTLRKRKDEFERLQAGWKKMLDEGAATVIDYNRILLELSGLNLEIGRTISEIKSLSAYLLYLAGNKTTLPEDPDYLQEITLDQDSLVSIKTATHPAFLMPQTEYLISRGALGLSKTGSLPAIQVGYSSEAVPGETYAGPVVGVSIPLWANSNRIKTASAKSDHIAAARDAEILRLISETVKEYETMTMLRRSLDEIKGIIRSNGDVRFIRMALDSGEISLTEYFSYISGTYDAEERLLEIENEYFKSVARLNDYKMLSQPPE